MLEGGVHLFAKYIQDLRWRVLHKRKELLLCSHFEAYSICNETPICPLWVYFLPEFLCMSLKCHLDHPFLVFNGVKTAINWQQDYFSYSGQSVKSQMLRYVCSLSAWWL